jgi:hypothetical protein
MLAGRLTGTLDGRPVVIDADDSGLLVSMPSLGSAWAARRSVGSLLPVLKALERGGVRLRTRIAGLVTVDLLPQPSGLARLFIPELARLRT